MSASRLVGCNARHHIITPSCSGDLTLFQMPAPVATLQSQFGLGLKEAAANLGMCATTLKRACRRHGIKRWPRRQIAKCVGMASLVVVGQGR